MLLIDIHDSNAERWIISVVNEGHKKAGVRLCNEILQAQIAPPEDVMILTPYDGQYRLYLSKLAYCPRNDPHLGLDRVKVRTIDGLQAQEGRSSSSV